VARAQNDAEIGTYLTGESRDAALRYREVDVWRELVQVLADRSLAVAGPSGQPATAQLAPAAPPPETRPSLVEPSAAEEQL